MSYAAYKFQKAMGELTGRGSLRERLLNAYMINLINVEKDDLPVAVWREFEQFRNDMTRIKHGESTLSVEATVASMNESEVKDMADKIIIMYDIVTKSEQSHHAFSGKSVIGMV
jgi:hypothetical protein